MDPESVVPNLRYILLYQNCTPLNPIQESTIHYLSEAYKAMCSTLGLSAFCVCWKHLQL